MKKNNTLFLQKYEADLITALFYDYTRQLPMAVLQEMNRIYEEETEKNLMTNFGCSNCIVHLVKQCAKIYFIAHMDRIPEKLRDRGKV